MKALAAAISVLLVVCLSGYGASELVANANASTAVDLSKGSIGAFTMLMGFVLYLLKEVQSIDSKDALSDIGIERLRRVQHIAFRRLFWLLLIGILGFISASFVAFGSNQAIDLFRHIAFVFSSAALSLLIMFCFGYLPSLFFDLQKTRNRLSDIIRSNELRKTQLKALESKEGSNAS